MFLSHEGGKTVVYEGAADAWVPIGCYGNAYSSSAEENTEVKASLLEHFYCSLGHIRIIHPLFAVYSEILDCMTFLGQPERYAFFEFNGAMVIGYYDIHGSIISAKYFLRQH